MQNREGRKRGRGRERVVEFLKEGVAGRDGGRMRKKEEEK